MSGPKQRYVLGEPAALADVLSRFDALSALAEGRVFVAGLRAHDPNQMLDAGVAVEVYPGREGQGELEVLHAQHGLVYVAKPPGIATEPERRGATGTLVALIAKQLGLPIDRVHALSRLDVGVSGVVLLGIDAEARRRVNELRAQGRVKRRYVALAAGTPEPERGTWSDPIGKSSGNVRRRVDPRGEPAETHYRVAARSAPAAAQSAATDSSVLALEPTTGRTHQLRVHAAAHGAPLFGDRTYGGPGRLVLPSGEVRALARVLLHAAWVQIEGQPRVACPLPGDFSAAWQSLGGEPQALQSAFDEPVLV
ncbi:MAG TPA: RluA family pseudouridine synthase [Polyangiaceae bacterium]|jgi:23S rRNA-/tRNA-specific pseudouridylate synthase|nr:RluA family pseudouridine synthase [Polyangiaceae bacterium]